MEVLLIVLVFFLLIVFPILSLLLELGINVLMILNVFFLITSVLSMISNYKSIENKIPTYDVNVEKLMAKLLTKFIVHTILWTIFVLSFYLIMIS